MQKYEEQKFDIPELKGISKKSVEEHLKLYSGYVKNTNLIIDKIAELSVDSEKNAFVLGELQRRFAFEFDGMRNHEYYFRSLEGSGEGSSEAGESGNKKVAGVKKLTDIAQDSKSLFTKAIITQFGSFDAWLARFKVIATTRGIGWAILSYDMHAEQLVHGWVDEQHLGHLNGLQYIFGIDMWEHSYVYDYQPSGKKQYIEDFLVNVNWAVIEQNFLKALKTS
jgi:Fe-Mn family superoxide dismutase